MTDEIFDGNVDIQNKPPATGKTTIKLLGGKLGGAGVETKGGAIFIGGEDSDGTVNFFPKAQLDRCFAHPLRSLHAGCVSAGVAR